MRRAFSEDRSLDCFVINNKQLEYYLQMMGIIFRRTDVTFKYLDRIFPQLQLTSAMKFTHVQRGTHL